MLLRTMLNILKSMDLVIKPPSHESGYFIPFRTMYPTNRLLSVTIPQYNDNNFIKTGNTDDFANVFDIILPESIDILL